MTKLHLGCGKHHIDGYVNIDACRCPSVDAVDDVRYLRSFHCNSVKVIYACNVLEHLGRFEYKPALKRWYDMLKKGGVLRLSLPNFEAVCSYYYKTRDLDTIMCALYAGQDSPKNYHYWCWDFRTISRDLIEAGFRSVQTYDRDKTEHADVKDWSINFMPYQDKDGNNLSDEEWFKGTDIALNVEAKK